MNSFLTSIEYTGKVGTSRVNIYNATGIRPIVCLKAGLKIEKNPSTGNYRIVK